MSDLELTMMRRVGELNKENARLKAEVERIREAAVRMYGLYDEAEAQVERLTKAVMHSPAAQLKLKELEGKTTFDEINPKDDNSNITTELLVLCNRQASDIRRLTKAGDTIIQILCKYVPPTGAKYALMDWRDAKEGKGQP